MLHRRGLTCVSEYDRESGKKIKEDELCGKFIYAFDAEEQIEQTFRSAAGAKTIPPVSPEEKGKHLHHTKRGILQQTDRQTFPATETQSLFMFANPFWACMGSVRYWGRKRKRLRGVSFIAFNFFAVVKLGNRKVLGSSSTYTSK